MIPTNIHRTPITATKLLGLMEGGESGPIDSYAISNDNDVAMSAVRLMQKQAAKKSCLNDLSVAIADLQESTHMAMAMWRDLQPLSGGSWLAVGGDTRQLQAVNEAKEMIKVLNQRLVDMGGCF